MTRTPDDHLADMFGLPPPAASPPSTAEDADAAEAAEAALVAAEAALAAEFAAEIEAGGVAGDAPDSRSDRRVAVSWPGRLQLPGGRAIELEVRNVSGSGVGLLSREAIPAGIVASFAMRVPHPDGGGRSTPVEGTIKTTYSVAHGTGVLCGGTWQGLPASLDVVTRWIDRLRG